MVKYMQKKKNFSINLMVIMTVMSFLILVGGLFKVMILDQKKHETMLLSLTSKETTGESAPRGRIYDRNYKLLVDNVPVRVIKYQKSRDVSTKDEIELSYQMSKIIILDSSKLLERNAKEFYLLLNKNKMNEVITEEEWEKYENKKLSNNDIENLKISRITDEMLQEMSDDDKLAAYLYYLMNKGYSYDEKLIKREVTDEEYAYIAEHASSVGGFYLDTTWERTYLYGDTFKSILGTVSTEESGIPKELVDTYLDEGYSLNDRVGISYLERQYESYLKGTKAVYKINSSYHKELIKEAERGNDIVLTIDIDIQKQVENILKEEVVKAKSEPNTKYYNRSFVVLTDPNTGEILAMSGKQLLNGEIIDYTPGIVTSPVTVGSVIKGASILVGYNSGVLNIGDVFVDECIKIASTPKKCSWKTLGPINDIKALAMSSNIYQFKVAMRVAGANYQYNQPLKIDPEAFNIYRNMYHSFGLGVKTEIDLPTESLGYSGDSVLPGHLLDLVMGQYDTYTPIQLSQYISTIANGGKRLKPHLLKEVHQSSSTTELGEIIYEETVTVLNEIEVDSKYINRVKEGFYAVAHASYGIGHNYINDLYDGAGKTGTSQSFIDTNGDGVIDQETVSTAFVGYAPSNDPKISIVVVSPDINNPHGRTDSVSQVTKRITNRVTQSYFDKN